MSYSDYFLTEVKKLLKEGKAKLISYTPQEELDKKEVGKYEKH